MIHRKKRTPPRHTTRLQIELLEPRMTLSAHPLAALVHGHRFAEPAEGRGTESPSAMIARANVVRAPSMDSSHEDDTEVGEKAEVGEKEGLETATFTQTSLASNDTATIPTANQDANLVNPWGIALDKSTGLFWVANNGTGTITQLDSAGAASSLVITVPSPTPGVNGSPTGLVLNSGSKFALKDGSPSTVLVATEQGTIAAWGPSLTDNVAQTVVDNSASGAVYKGLAMAKVGGKTYLYATDFHNNTIDVFDTSFNKVTTLAGTFTDPGTVPLPPLPDGAIGYAPFGISNIRGKLYVTYAAQDSAAHDDVKGAGRASSTCSTPTARWCAGWRPAERSMRLGGWPRSARDSTAAAAP